MKNRYARLALVVLACGYFAQYAATYTGWHFIDVPDLIFHEAGHTIFFFLGEFVQVAAGSGFQIAVPLAIALYFFSTQQKVSGAICLMWTAANILNVSVYAGDAIAMQLPLLGGDGVMHDWNYLLRTLGILRYAPQVAGTLYALGLMVLALGSGLALYFGWYGEDK